MNMEKGFFEKKEQKQSIFEKIRSRIGRSLRTLLMASVLLSPLKSTEAKPIVIGDKNNKPDTELPVDTNNSEGSEFFDVEKGDQEKDKDFEKINFSPTFIQENPKTGEKEFNWMSIIAPFDLTTSTVENTQYTTTFTVPYEYARLFSEDPKADKEINSNDYQLLSNYVKTELQTELKNAFHGFGFSENVYNENHPGELEDQSIKVEYMKVVGMTSPEGHVKNGKETIIPGNIDEDNIELGHTRAKAAERMTLDELKKLGVNTDEVESFVRESGSIENQCTEEEMNELAELAKNYNGVDDIERIFQLYQDYNQGKIKDQNVVNELDRIIGSKRCVEIEIGLEGQRRIVVAIPIPLLLLLPLVWRSFSKKRKDEKGGKEPEPTPVKDEKQEKVKVEQEQSKPEEILYNLYEFGKIYLDFHHFDYFTSTSLEELNEYLKKALFAKEFLEIIKTKQKTKEIILTPEEVLELKEYVKSTENTIIGIQSRINELSKEQKSTKEEKIKEEKQESGPRVDPNHIPEKVKKTELPDNQEEYREMTSFTIEDLYIGFDNPDNIKLGIDYRAVFDYYYSHYEEFKDTSNLEAVMAYEILISWKEHDIANRRMAGLSNPEEGMDYENNEKQIQWAKMHARQLIEIIKRIKNNESVKSKLELKIEESQEQKLDTLNYILDKLDDKQIFEERKSLNEVNNMPNKGREDNIDFIINFLTKTAPSLLEKTNTYLINKYKIKELQKSSTEKKEEDVKDVKDFKKRFYDTFVDFDYENSDDMEELIKYLHLIQNADKQLSLIESGVYKVKLEEKIVTNFRVTVTKFLSGVNERIEELNDPLYHLTVEYKKVRKEKVEKWLNE